MLPKFAVLFIVLLAIAPSWCAHEISDCGGSHVKFSGQSNNSDDVTKVPGGSIVLSITATVSTIIPEGVALTKLIRRDSDNAIVPCLDGISGSCQMDLCSFFVNYPNENPIPVTRCPISTQSFIFNTELLFNELWLPINGDMQNATYNMRYEVKEDQEVIGCFEFPFTLNSVI